MNIPASRELAGGIPSAGLRILPGATHVRNLRQPDALTATVADFVAGVDTARAAEPARSSPGDASPGGQEAV